MKILNLSYQQKMQWLNLFNSCVVRVYANISGIGW
ncbi:hypothetical protein [Escherichia phage dw-ec]|nr:hypothetical protein [Escherichia phage dw-ec]